MKAFIQELQYPYWLMVAGALLLIVGFVGFALRKNREGDPSRPG
jgi:LPXTG-motif cell wall-anchored protein